MHRAELPCDNNHQKAGAKPVKEKAMLLMGILNEHDTVRCATRNHNWNTRYLVNDLGRARLGGAGFAAIVSADGAIFGQLVYELQHAGDDAPAGAGAATGGCVDRRAERRQIH